MSALGPNLAAAKYTSFTQLHCHAPCTASEEVPKLPFHADLDEESEAEDERDLILGGEDYENDSDADLDALLEDANRLIGRPASSGRKRAKTGKGRRVNRVSEADEDEEEEEAAEYMYDDFWGPAGKKNSSRSRKQGGAVYNSMSCLSV